MATAGSDCCRTTEAPAPNPSKEADACPRCHTRGKPVDNVTLKSLLTPAAMRRLEPHAAHRFCRTPECPVVYFAVSAVFTETDVTVPVFQKARGGSTPVCYCFGYTADSIIGAVNHDGKSAVVAQITEYVDAGACACELRNPQGSCCLGNVAQVFRESA